MFQKACECPNGAVYSFPKYNYKEDKDFDELKMDGHVARFKCREDKYCVCTSDSCYNAQDADGINIVSVCVDGRCDLKIVLEGSTAQLMPQDNKLKTYKTKDQNIDAFNTHKLSSEHYLGGVSSVVCKSCSSTSPPPKDTCSLSR
ncbi:hypothetical protein QR680_016592 [Steinernema hermaphroditum]|uniref:Uncharacterized protein n=1 Tax=Steinernema hermaphroditum TaxID=289476 RepID=A0AA39HBN9_9BILA|nr:hypothetical protein QR680_016592 [Steinernema hermaphroditum]